MKIPGVLWAAAALVFSAGCARGPRPAGKLELAQSGRAADGDAYVLEDAVFSVHGPVRRYLSSELHAMRSPPDCHMTSA